MDDGRYAYGAARGSRDQSSQQAFETMSPGTYKRSSFSMSDTMLAPDTLDDTLDNLNRSVSYRNHGHIQVIPNNGSE